LSFRCLKINEKIPQHKTIWYLAIKFAGFVKAF